MGPEDIRVDGVDGVIIGIGGGAGGDAGLEIIISGEGHCGGDSDGVCARYASEPSAEGATQIALWPPLQSAF
jgi:hypothetical protein